jgi:hypothetical protein
MILSGAIIGKEAQLIGIWSNSLEIAQLLKMRRNYHKTGAINVRSKKIPASF